jgi:hypothetical protein
MCACHRPPLAQHQAMASRMPSSRSLTLASAERVDSRGSGDGFKLHFGGILVVSSL